jgi:hydrogenase expression/formation protein HypC
VKLSFAWNIWDVEAHANSNQGVVQASENFFLQLIKQRSKNMCLAVPGKVIERFETNGIQMGKMDFDGITKNICLAYIPDIQIGEYALVHVGFAIEKLDEKSALESLELFRNMGFLEEELGLALEGESDEIPARVS